MAGRDDGGVGSAWRRRDRQLRAFRRHEQLTVRMELAAALHHSAQWVEGRERRGPREARRPTDTGATSPGDAAGASCGGCWATGASSHGRLRGCR